MEVEAKLAAEETQADHDLEKAVREAQAKDSDPAAEAWEYENPSILQELIDKGDAWRMEGSIGRSAMAALESGCCFLPTCSHRDYWGNLVPPRTALKPGSKGTLLNSARFWKIKVKKEKRNAKIKEKNKD